MSVYSHIEILGPKQKSQHEEGLSRSFGHGIPWWYQISVARGKRKYKGAKYSGNPELEQFEAASAFSTYELRITESLKNYQTVMSAFYEITSYESIDFNNKFYREMGLLLLTKRWFELASKRMPNGIVKLDWSEAAWGSSYMELANWDSPNIWFNDFSSMVEDSKKVEKGLMSQHDFNVNHEGFTRRDQIVEQESTDFPF